MEHIGPSLVLLNSRRTEFIDGCLRDDERWFILARSKDVEVWNKEKEAAKEVLIHKISFPDRIKLAVVLDSIDKEGRYLILLGSEWILIQIQFSCCVEESQNSINITELARGEFVSCIKNFPFESACYDIVKSSFDQYIFVSISYSGRLLCMCISGNFTSAWKVCCSEMLVDFLAESLDALELETDASTDSYVVHVVKSVCFLKSNVKSSSNSHILCILCEQSRQNSYFPVSCILYAVQLVFEGTGPKAISMSFIPGFLDKLMSSTYIFPWIRPCEVMVIDSAGVKVYDNFGMKELVKWSGVGTITFLCEFKNTCMELNSSKSYLVKRFGSELSIINIEESGIVFESELKWESPSIDLTEITNVRIDYIPCFELLLLRSEKLDHTLSLQIYEDSGTFYLIEIDTMLCFSDFSCGDMVILNDNDYKADSLVLHASEASTAAIYLQYGMSMNICFQEATELSRVSGIHAAPIDDGNVLLVFSSRSSCCSYSFILLNDGTVHDKHSSYSHLIDIQCKSTLLLEFDEDKQKIIQVSNEVISLYPLLENSENTFHWSPPSRIQHATYANSVLYIASLNRVIALLIDDRSIIEVSRFSFEHCVSVLACRNYHVAVSFFDCNFVVILKHDRSTASFNVYCSYAMNTKELNWRVTSLLFCHFDDAEFSHLVVGTTSGSVSILKLSQLSCELVSESKVGCGTVRMAAFSSAIGSTETEHLYLNGTEDAIFFSTDSGSISQQRVCCTSFFPRLFVTPLPASADPNCDETLFAWLQYRNESSGQGLELCIGSIHSELHPHQKDFLLKERVVHMCICEELNLIFFAVNPTEVSRSKLIAFDSNTLVRKWETRFPSTESRQIKALAFVTDYPVPETLSFQRPPGTLIAAAEIPERLRHSRAPPFSFLVTVYELTSNKQIEGGVEILMECSSPSLEVRGDCITMQLLRGSILMCLTSFELCAMGWRSFDAEGEGHSDNCSLSFEVLDSICAQSGDYFCDAQCFGDSVLLLGNSKSITLYSFQATTQLLIPTLRYDHNTIVRHVGDVYENEYGRPQVVVEAVADREHRMELCVLEFNEGSTSVLQTLAILRPTKKIVASKKGDIFVLFDDGMVGCISPNRVHSKANK